MDLIVLSLIVGVFTALYILLIHKAPLGHIPGPAGWPWIGNVLQLDPLHPQMTLMKWAQKFGDLYRIKIFGMNIVIVSGEHNLRHILVTDSKVFGDRTAPFRIRFALPEGATDDLVGGNYSSSGWRSGKKLMTKIMRMYGDGLKHLEEITNDITTDLIKIWKGKTDIFFNPKEDIMACLTNVMLVLIFGYKFSYESQEVKEIIQTVSMVEIFDSKAGFELDIFPWLRHFGHPLYKKLVAFKRFTNTTLNKLIDDSKATLDPKNPRGILDSLHIHVSSDDFDGHPNEPTITAAVLNLLLAGVQTTTSTLLFLIGQCILNQEFQKKLHTHIIEAIQERQPVLEDKPQLPLVEAAIFEALRMGSVLPTALPHVSTEDTNVGDIFIPKRTVVWPNLWSLHHDERYWDKPWEFNPDRFLDDGGQLLPPDHPNRKRLMPFSAGVRVCLGEALAKNRLFLFVTSLFQHFRFMQADSPPNCDPREQEMGIVLFIPPFKIKLEKAI